MENINEMLLKTDILKSYKIQAKDYLAQLTPIDYLDPNTNTNMEIFYPSTYSEFSECEKILRTTFNIESPRKITFVQIQLNNTYDVILVNQIEYQAYDDNKKELDLSLCKKNMTINYLIKDNLVDEVSLIDTFEKKGIDILDINDDFFNDICLPYSESGKDLSLNDRIKDYFKNYTFCEKNCEFNEIDYDKMMIACNCTIKDHLDAKYFNFEFPKNWTERKKTNYKITTCTNALSSLKDNLDNLGFWSFLGLLAAKLALLISFCSLGLKPFQSYLTKEMAKKGYIEKGDEGHAFCHNYIKKLNKLIERLNQMKINFAQNAGAPPKHKTHIVNSNDKSFRDKLIRKKQKVKTSKEIENDIEGLKKRMNKTRRIQNKKSSSKLVIHKSTKEALFDEKSSVSIYSKEKMNNKYNKHLKTQNSKNYSENKNDKKYIDLNLININLKDLKQKVYIPNESKHILNIYEFNEALKYDKRSLCSIYYIFLISKQVIMHTIFFKSPIEPLPLRLTLLISILEFDLALNAFFYTDDQISERHYSPKNIFTFGLTNNIVIILLSTLIGYVILTIFTNLNNATNEIRKLFRAEEEKIKKDKNYKVTVERKKEIIIEIRKIMRNLKIKIILFYIFEILVMIFFWYYSTVFCFVFNKTQLSWIIDCFISILFRIIFDLLINFLFSLLYINSIGCKCNCLYSVIIFIYCFS